MTRRWTGTALASVVGQSHSRIDYRAYIEGYGAGASQNYLFDRPEPEPKGTAEAGTRDGMVIETANAEDDWARRRRRSPNWRADSSGADRLGS